MKQFLHDKLGWGYPDGIADKDEYGFQDTYKCRFCDFAITQDSTGAWFHLSSKTKDCELVDHDIQWCGDRYECRYCNRHFVSASLPTKTDKPTEV